MIFNNIISYRYLSSAIWVEYCKLAYKLSKLLIIIAHLTLSHLTGYKNIRRKLPYFEPKFKAKSKVEIVYKPAYNKPDNRRKSP